MPESTTPFASRRKLLTVRADAQQVALQIRQNLGSDSAAALRALLDDLHPADLADAMLFLAPQEERQVFQLLDNLEAAEVLDEVDSGTEANLVAATSADRLADIIEELPADEG